MFEHVVNPCLFEVDPNATEPEEPFKISISRLLLPLGLQGYEISVHI